MGQRLVDVACRLAPDTQLDHDEVGALEGGRPHVGGGDPRRSTGPPEHPAREAGDGSEALQVGIHQRQLVDGETVGPAREPLHELGRVRATRADDGDLQAHLPGSSMDGRAG